MGWQADLFAQLRDRQWHQLGELYELVQARIPLHTAMRNAMLRRKEDDFPANSTARWQFFLQTMRFVGVEFDGDPWHRRYSDRVRLKHVAGKSCEACGGPVIKAGWASRDRVACLACEMPPAPVEVPLPVCPPKAEIIEIKPTIGWTWRANRAFAEFIKRSRLPFLSVSQIVKGLERSGRDVGKFLLSRGKKPITVRESNRWFEDYMREHPP